MQAYVYTNPSTCGLNNGYAYTYVYNGSSPYEYEWSNGETDYYNEDLVQGLYNVTISDVYGCTFETSGYVDNIQQLSSNFYNTNPHCGVADQVSLPPLLLMEHHLILICGRMAIQHKLPTAW